MQHIKNIVNHSFWLLIGNSLGRLTMFLTNIVAARLLSQETFGQFMMIRNTVSMLQGVVSGSLGSSMIKRISEVSHRNKNHLPIVMSSLFFLNMIIAFFLSVALVIFTPFLVDTFFASEKVLIQGFYIGSVLVLTTTLSTLMQSILTGFEAYKIIAVSGIITSILAFPLIYFLIVSYGLYGAILGVVSYFFIDFFVKYFQFRKIYQPSSVNISFDEIWKENKQIISFSSPLFLTVIINSFTFWYARVLVVDSSQGFESIAIFDAAFQWLTIIMIITGATTSVVLPMLSKHEVKDTVKKIFTINLYVNLTISIGIAIIFILFSEEIMSVYGSSYLQGSDTLIVLSLTSILFTLSSLYNKLMISQSQTWIVFFASLLGAISLFFILYIMNIKNEIGLAYAFFAYYGASLLFYSLYQWYRN